MWGRGQQGRCQPTATSFSSHIHVHWKLCKGLSGESNPFQSDPNNLCNNEEQHSPVRIITSTVLGDARVRVQLPSSLGTSCGWTHPWNLPRHRQEPSSQPQQHRHRQVTAARLCTTWYPTTAYTTYPSKELNIHALTAILYFIRNVFTQLGLCFVLIPKARCNIIVWQGKDIWKMGETNPWITY